MKKLATLLFVQLISLSSFFAQDITLENWNELKKDPNLGTQLFIQYKFHWGNHLYTGVTFSEYLQNKYFGHETRLGWRTKGKSDWEKALNYPFYGVGLYSAYIGDPQFMGRPSGAYGFLHLPILRRPRHHFNFELALGLTYRLVDYDPNNNPNNDAIGSSCAVYFNTCFGGNYYINSRWEATYGFDFTHFSNGRIYTPNFGINMDGFNLGVRYNFNPIRAQEFRFSI